MKLPYIQTADRVLSQLQTTWMSLINPIISVPMLQGLQLNGIILQNGVNTINHLLARQQQGWYITDIDGAAQIYRSQPFNDKTLTLTSNSAVSVNLWVY